MQFPWQFVVFLLYFWMDHNISCIFFELEEILEISIHSGKMDSHHIHSWHQFVKCSTHTIHAAGIFAYMNGWFVVVDVVKYAVSYMDGMG